MMSGFQWYIAPKSTVNTQEVVAPSQHDCKIVYLDVKHQTKPKTRKWYIAEYTVAKSPIRCHITFARALELNCPLVFQVLNLTGDLQSCKMECQDMDTRLKDTVSFLGKVP